MDLSNKPKFTRAMMVKEKVNGLLYCDGNRCRPSTPAKALFGLFVVSALMLVGLISWQSIEAVFTRNAQGLIGQADYTSANANYYSTTVANTAGLGSPNFMELDETNHRLFVTDGDNNRVLVFNLDSSNDLIDRTADYVLGQSSFITSDAATTQSGLSSPQGLAFNSASNTLFVADTSNSRVLVFDVAEITNGENAVKVLGQSAFDTADAATTQSGLSSPQGLTFNSASNTLFVADTSNNRVLVFDVAEIINGENAINVLGESDFVSSATTTPTISSLSGPRGLAFFPASNTLFVVDAVKRRVLAFNVAEITNGENAINVLGQSNFTNGGSATTQSGLDAPRGAAFDAARKYLFVGEYNNACVKVFDVATIVDGENAINILGQSDFTNPSWTTAQDKMSGVWGVAYNASKQYLYAADRDVSRIVVFDTATIVDGENAVDALGHIDDSGNPIYTCSAANNACVRAKGLSSPRGLALDTTYHRLFVSDYSNNRILVFNLNSSNLLLDSTADYVLGQSDFSSNGVAVTQSRLEQPQGLAFDSASNTLYVVDEYNSRVLVFDTASITNGENATAVLGQANFTADEECGTVDQNSLCYPQGAAIDVVDKLLYVADNTANRVVVFDVNSISNGEDAAYVLGQNNFDGSGSATTQGGLNAPAIGVILSSDNKTLYLSDSNNRRVMVFDVGTIENGENATKVLGQADFTSSGSAATQSGVATVLGLSLNTADSFLYAVDNGNHRVMVFDVAAITNGENAVSVLGQTDFTSNSAATTQSGLSAPYGLAYDPTNKILYVADTSNNRVVLYKFVNVTTASLDTGTIGIVYSASLATENSVGAVTYAITSGSLPGGMSLNSVTGVISGAPSASGQSTFTITATETDSPSTYSDSVEYTLAIASVSSGSGGSSSYDMPEFIEPIFPTTTAETPVSEIKKDEPAMEIKTIEVPDTTQKQLLVRGATPNSAVTLSPKSLETLKTYTQSGRSLYFGRTGKEVKALQEFLASKGLFKVAPTGYFGPITRNAVINFQKANQLSAAGTVGPATRRAILKILDIGY